MSESQAETPPQQPQLSPELQARKDKADVAKAEADAAKAAADARAADATARKTAAEAADHDAPSARQQREAEARKAIAEADKDAASARQTQLGALIPDFGKVKDSTLDVKDGPSIGATALAFAALRRVADKMSQEIVASISVAHVRLLVTSDPDLATTDAQYQDVYTGLVDLASASDKLLDETDPEKIETASFMPAMDLAAALASAVPDVLSLLTSHRTVGTAAVTVTDLAAASAVAGALKTRAPALTVLHDDFRLVPTGAVYEQADQLSQKRQQLGARKIQLNDKKSTVDGDLTDAQNKKKGLEDDIAKATSDKQAEKFRVDLDNTEKQIAALTKHSGELSLRIGLIDGLTGSIDTFTTAIRTIPQGARRSPLAIAALQSVLHSQEPDKVTHVLLVKGEGGQAAQVTENRPLWFEDKFSTLADVSVTHILINLPDSAIVASGTTTSTAAARGTIGGDFEVKVETTKDDVRTPSIRPPGRSPLVLLPKV